MVYNVSLSVDNVVSGTEESEPPETAVDPDELSPGGVAGMLSGVNKLWARLSGRLGLKLDSRGGYKGLKGSDSSSNSRTISPGFESLIGWAR